MAPSEFSLRLQHGSLTCLLDETSPPNLLIIGIQGGFAPPTPNAIHTVTRANSNQTSLQITSAVRPDGTPHLEDALPKNLAHDDSVDALVGELHGILKSIPTEQPPGSEDIYGLDTSIAWGSEDLMWCNGGPQGCGGGSSQVQPSDEEKAKFARAVEIVKELVAKAG